jgi:amidase
MARHLAGELRAAYDAALSEYDVIVMPTLPYTAREIPPDDVSLPDYLDTALSMIGNTAPFDVTGHPACSVPAGLVDGMPAGMMIIGKRFADATVLRMARTYEQAAGGFARPPMAVTTMG